MKTHIYIIALIAVTTPLPAATIDMLGGGSVKDAKGVVEFSIGKGDSPGAVDMALDPYEGSTMNNLTFFYEWNNDWLWVGLRMPRTNLAERTFSHFIGDDYTEKWVVNQYDAPEEGIRNGNLRLGIQFTDGYIATPMLGAYVTWIWDGETATGTMPWQFNTFDPIANKRYVDSLPVPDTGSTAFLMGLGLLWLSAHRIRTRERLALPSRGTS